MKLRFNRRLIEEIVIITGIIGLILVFQPFSVEVYMLGWILLITMTLLYVTFTLVPSYSSGQRLIKKYMTNLLIIMIIVLTFVLLSILLTPYLVR